MPMIPPGRLIIRVHALLYYRPLPGTADDEVMGVQLETVLHEGVVDFRTQLAAPHQGSGIQPGPVAQLK